jgi:hypothetical protein
MMSIKWLGCIMVFSATFNNISVISWRSVLLVYETGVPGEKNQRIVDYVVRSNVALNYKDLISYSITPLFKSKIYHQFSLINSGYKYNLIRELIFVLYKYKYKCFINESSVKVNMRLQREVNIRA